MTIQNLNKDITTETVERKWPVISNTQVDCSFACNGWRLSFSNYKFVQSTLSPASVKKICLGGYCPLVYSGFFKADHK